MAGLVFVVGVGRSGTSLLQSMLNAHPAICFAPETSFLRRLVATGVLERLFRSAGPHAVASFLERDALVARLGIERSELRVLVLAQGAQFGAAGLYRDLLSACCRQRKKGAAFIGDKDPRSVELLKLMKKLLPDAFVLHITRDPRDVLASKKKAEWSRGRSVLAHLFAHRVQERMGREWGPALFGARYLELRYEELVAQPTATLERACAVLGIEFDARMLDFAASSRELVAPDEMAWKQETLGPLVDNRNKWHEALTSWEVALAEAVCADALRQNGYAPSTRAGMAVRLAARTVASLSAVGDPLYRGYRSWRQA
jgi:hypothetical protein